MSSLNDAGQLMLVDDLWKAYYTIKMEQEDPESEEKNKRIGRGKRKGVEKEYKLRRIRIGKKHWVYLMN